MIDRRQLTRGICIGIGAAALGAPLRALANEMPSTTIGSVVLDAATGHVLFREGPCGTRFSPASTFKIPIALMGYDAGILTDEHRPSWDYRPEFNAPERNRKTVDPTIWQWDSVVWYSQEITRHLGTTRFQDYIDRLGYGNRDLSGNPGRKDGLTQSWLMSSLKISPDEQVAFLQRSLDRTLPVSRTAQDMTAAILPQFTAEGGWTVHGKTGSGILKTMAGKNAADHRSLGWFVGWAERDGRRVVFARLEIGTGTPGVRGGLTARASLLTGLAAMANR